MFPKEKELVFSECDGGSEPRGKVNFDLMLYASTRYLVCVRKVERLNINIKSAFDTRR